MKSKNTKFKNLKVISSPIYRDTRGSFREIFKKIFFKEKFIFTCVSSSKKNVATSYYNDCTIQWQESYWVYLRVSGYIFFVYIFTFSVSSLLLSFSGLDFLTCISAAASAISNVGPGLGEVIGPEGNYSSLTNYTKLILTLKMFLGRL